jgi:hypothetical protein
MYDISYITLNVRYIVHKLESHVLFWPRRVDFEGVPSCQFLSKRIEFSQRIGNLAFYRHLEGFDVFLANDELTAPRS